MTGVYFPIFAKITILIWILSIICLFLSGKKHTLVIPAVALALLGVLVLCAFIVFLWIKLGRPPLRTLGETRLWYAFLLSAVGFFSYLRWKYKWFIGYTLGMAILFLFLNYLHPENFDKTLMPALQSIWFVPHVILFIFSYSIFAASAISACNGLVQIYIKKKPANKTLDLADNFVYLGFALFTLGMLFGALWAKEAWGHYWSWDPKETWAFITWMIYINYLHYRRFQPQHIRAHLWILFVGFLVLLTCWFGVNYLPSAKESIHTYTQ